ncbi:MAG: hypothetical protein ACREJG_05575 [Candidatus Rokuibacteriota bacterium]
MIRSRAMRSLAVSRLSWLVLVYVALEFSNPMMPGAFTFDIEESVDGVSRQSHRAHEPSVTTVAGRDASWTTVPDRSTLDRPPRPRPVTHRVPTVVVRHTLPCSMPAALDDH